MVRLTMTGSKLSLKRDPSDDKFLECALAGKARVIISGDKDLLSIRTYRQIRIQTPAQFLDESFQIRRL